MAEMDVAVINFNTRDLLRACLISLRAEPVGRVRVVDNDSSDGSAAMVKEAFPEVILVENHQNRGYGAAANQAIRASTARYVLLLNSDTRVLPGAVQSLLDDLESNPRIAIAGPRLLNPDGSLQTSTFPLPTLLDLFLDASHLVRLAARIPFLRERSLRTWSHDQPRAVPWVSGAALAIRRAAFDQVGGFDETFSMYYEEADLCCRLAQRGWETRFLPSSQVYHIGGASTQQRWSEMAIQLYSSLAHFYQIHYSPVLTILLVWLVKTIALARWVRDHLFLFFARETTRRQVMSRKIAAWQGLLTTHWER